VSCNIRGALGVLSALLGSRAAAAPAIGRLCCGNIGMLQVVEVDAGVSWMAFCTSSAWDSGFASAGRAWTHSFTVVVAARASNPKSPEPQAHTPYILGNPQIAGAGAGQDRTGQDRTGQGRAVEQGSAQRTAQKQHAGTQAHWQARKICTLTTRVSKKVVCVCEKCVCESK
jgi:hypothetical protein